MKERDAPKLGELFLTNFIETILEHIAPKEIPIENPLEKPINKEYGSLQIERIVPEPRLQKIIPIIQNQIPINETQTTELTSPISTQHLNPRVLTMEQKQDLFPSITNPYDSRQTPQLPLTRQQSIRPINLRPFPSAFTQPTNIPFKKISPFLNNPAIMSIECQGPGKNLIINRGGMIQATPVTLTQNEIEEIMNDISSKTRIPLIKGVFKAALGNLIISAVISEFVGTRFHIEKMRRPLRM